MGSSKCPAEKCQITRTKQRGRDRDMYNLNQLKDLALVERMQCLLHMIKLTQWANRMPNVHGHLGTTFAVFICLSSKEFAGWCDFVFQTIVCLLFFNFNGFGGKMMSQD